MPDLEDVIRQVCPVCGDPAARRDDVAVYCGLHTPSRAGLDDDQVGVAWPPHARPDAGGAENAAWCDFFHRKKILLMTPRG